MTKDEVLDLLDDMVAVYGRRVNMENGKKVIRLWTSALADCDKSKVHDNFISYIQNSAFPPTPADLTKNALRKKKATQIVIDLSKGEDWNV